MEIKVVAGDIYSLAVDAIIVGLFEGVSPPQGAAAAVDGLLEGEISRLIAEGELKGKLYEVHILHTLGRLPARRVAVVGLGKPQELNLDRVRGAAGEVARALRRANAQRVATVLLGAEGNGLEPQKVCQAVVEGSLLGLYTFRQHITKPPESKEIQEILVVEKDKARLPALERGLKLGQVMAQATNLARDLVNEPANVMTPQELAGRALQVARDWGLECEILDQEQIKEKGMGGLLGVAQGSRQPPQFIILRYWGGPQGQTPLGLVGKGITFDSGGISLKPAEGMGDMKGDMAGGAAVIAALRALAELKPPINVVGLVPATENLPSGSALKPGDILRILNGKTVEIVSTDAEGRLILADALSYARQQGLSPLVDLATLTGACHIALGDLYSGAFSNSQELLNQVVEAGKEAGERHWPLPLVEEYKEQYKSEVADIKNVGGRYGGAITAALFLGEFAEDTPWVHLDIAGPVRSEKERSYQVKGATGVGVRTLVNLALARAEKE